MQKLTLELPESLMHELKQRAARQERPVEEVIVEQLSNGVDREAPEPRSDRFYSESELFERPTEEESQGYQALAEEELRKIGRKLVAAGPLSETIIEERRQGH